MKDPKKKRKVSMSRAKNAADVEFSRFIRLRDRRCVLCGSVQNLQCSHLFTKAQSNAVRWDARNAHTLCAACHYRHHTRPDYAFYEWTKKRIGEQDVEEIRASSKQTTDWTPEHVQSIARYYKGLADQLEA